MKFKFIGNAAGIFYGNKGTSILCDPWIVNGVFEGSWFHYPPLKTKIKDLYNVDAIYVSHIHPDHYDERHFNFPKNKPIIILDQEPNFLKKNLLSKGFKNIISVKNDETKKFKEFELTLYKPFSKHIFEESLLGNLIDSAIVLKDQKNTAINFNDNTPDEKSCIFLNKKFKRIDLALLNYNAAGPYPSCFDNLSKKKKISEHKRIIKRNFDHLVKVIPKLQPKTILPFAGSYILGGKNFFKNDYLGTSNWEECSRYLKKKLNKKFNIICMRENQIFDLENKRSNFEYTELNLSHMQKYIKKISNYKYDYERDKPPSYKKLVEDINLAKSRFADRIKKFNIKINSNVFLNFENKKIKIIDGKLSNRKIVCKLDSKLLRRILDKKAHWNNAEIGAHITFFRTPNKMEPDLHTSLSFFHL